MLKRQRAVSPPPPSSSNVPLVSDMPGDLIAERTFKKQRIAPPALDGRMRGWGHDSEMNAEDDGEEDYPDDQSEHMEPSTSGYAHPLSPSENEYKSANTVLRELHTLHQHRLLFSSPSPSGGYTAAVTTVAQSSPPLLHGPSPLRNQLGKERVVTPSLTKDKSYEKDEKDESMLVEEAHRVAERYEGLNKMLGSYVLSRRRTLNTSEEIPEP